MLYTTDLRGTPHPTVTTNRAAAQQAALSRNGAAHAL